MNTLHTEHRAAAEPLAGKARSKKIRDLIHQAAMTCGAHARSTGQPTCKLPPASLTTGNGRCRFHGGLSTGPRTVAGYQRLLESLQRRWARGKKSKPA